MVYNSLESLTDRRSIDSRSFEAGHCWALIRWKRAGIDSWLLSLARKDVLIEHVAELVGQGYGFLF